MKKILIMLSVLGLVHFSANAQVGTGASHNNTPNMKQGDQGQKIDVIEGRNNAANTTTSTGTHMPMHVTHATTHSATAYHRSVHHVVHHTYARAGVHHTTVHHATAHRSTHAVAMRGRTTHAVAMHRTVKHAYSAHRANVYSGSSATMHHAAVTPPVDNAKNQNAAANRKIPDTPYPGASNGGWSNGTNGKGGTNTQDGTIKTERRDH